MNWICVQDGAREHFAIPRALQRTGRLEMLFTEVWAGPGWRAAARILPVSALRAVAARWHPELEARSQKSEIGGQSAEIVAWNWQTVWREACLKGGKQKAESGNPHKRFVRDGRWFSEKVRDHLASHGSDVRGKVIFSYDTTALELFRWGKEQGAVCVLGQMDPGRVEMDLVREEEARWPGWAKEKPETRKPETLSSEARAQELHGPRKAESEKQGLEEYCRRREREWKLADRIIVNSRWSFDALVKQGVPEQKLVVVPLCYESRKQKAESRNEFQVSGFSFSASRPLRVLFLGQVVLRKGIQYLIEAAKLLADGPVVFDVVGPVAISEAAVKLAPDTVRFHGRANRDGTAAWYGQSDVFVLPTISDGFAITQIEALAHGLPVIATPNCGEVVTDGADGFVVPARNAKTLAEIFRRYLARPDLLAPQRAAALQKAEQFTLARLGTHLLELETQLAKASVRSPSSVVSGQPSDVILRNV